MCLPGPQQPVEVKSTPASQQVVPSHPLRGPARGQDCPRVLPHALRSTAVDRSTPIVTCGCADGFHIITSILQFYDSGCRGFEPPHSPSQGTRSTAVSRVLTPAAGCSQASPWGRNGAGLHRPRQCSASAGLPGTARTWPVARSTSALLERLVLVVARGHVEDLGVRDVRRVEAHEVPGVDPGPDVLPHPRRPEPLEPRHVGR